MGGGSAGPRQCLSRGDERITCFARRPYARSEAQAYQVHRGPDLARRLARVPGPLPMATRHSFTPCRNPRATGRLPARPASPRPGNRHVLQRTGRPAHGEPRHLEERLALGGRPVAVLANRVVVARGGQDDSVSRWWGCRPVSLMAPYATLFGDPISQCVTEATMADQEDLQAEIERLRKNRPQGPHHARRSPCEREGRVRLRPAASPSPSGAVGAPGHG